MKKTRNINRLTLLAACAFLLAASIAGCSSNTGATGALDKDVYFVKMTMSDGSVMIFELSAKAAPITVENFLKLVGDNFYDGLTFHRAAPGFVIQGGDPAGDGTGGPGWQIKGEFSYNGYANPIKHVRGVISMARSASGYDTAGSQFFIVLDTSATVTSALDSQYAAFGKVYSGMEVADAIALLETDADELIVGEKPVIAKMEIIDSPFAQ